MRLLSILLILTLANCTNDSQRHAVSSRADSIQTISKTEKQYTKEPSGETDIVCDSVYPGKGYKITLALFDSTGEDETNPNTIFTLSKLTNGRYLPLYKDSIFCDEQEVQFADFNNDKVKDILVRSAADMRSNLTYHLYIVDPAHNSLKNIRGFEEIKNPNYLSRYNLIDNYVLSGQIWTAFYQIQGDSVRDFGKLIYDTQTDDGSYDREYRKAINSILAGKDMKH